ncbi:MAG: hypothetical protein ACRC1I_25350 [Pseudomonas proteolytica]|uniref:hypothetical protein n=1 Tax=Pseudomonas proteolytica TaxID=219574 RepID=UPI003F2C45A7
MGLTFVKEPVKTDEEKRAFQKSRSGRSIDELLSKPVSLTEAEQTLISGCNQRNKVFKETHHYVLEDASETQQLSYILGHRGGVVFPGTEGMSTAQLDDYARQTLSALRNGSYRRRDGLPYSYESFKNDVRGEFKAELKEGWVKKTDDSSGYSVIDRDLSIEAWL